MKTSTVVLIVAASCVGVGVVGLGGALITARILRPADEPLNTDESEAASESDPKLWTRGHVHVQAASADDFTEVDTLLVTILIKSTDPNRKVPFREWERSATATDSRGNACRVRPLNFDMLRAIHSAKESLSAKWGYGTGSVTSDRPRFEMIAFDRPVPTARYLDVTLNAKQVGESGTIRFRIPREMWASK